MIEDSWLELRKTSYTDLHGTYLRRLASQEMFQ